MLTPAINNSLLKVFGIENADAAKQQEFLDSFSELAEEIVLQCAMANLQGTDLQTFLQFLSEDETGDKAIQFAQQKIPDFAVKLQTLMQEEMQKINY